MLSNKLALLTVLASMAGLVSAAPSSDVGAGKRFNKARLDTRWGRHGGHGGHHSQGNDQASASAVASSAASDNETAPVTSSYAAAAVETFAAAVATTSAAAAVPTTAAAAAATTTAASSSGSSDVKTGGIATYFLQGGNAGACGTVHADSDLVVALPTTYYSEANCGKQITISAASTGQTITATVADLCPSCVGTNSIDLSIGAISALAGSTDYTQEGVYDVTWSFI